MTRGLVTLMGLALVAYGVTVTVVRLHADGHSAFAIAGLAVLAIVADWNPRPLRE